MDTSKPLNIYLVWQTKNFNYDSYDSFIVVAPDTRTAKRTYPHHPYTDSNKKWVEYKGWHFHNVHHGLMKDDASSWVREFKDIKVKKIGVANANQKAGIICVSFNAG